MPKRVPLWRKLYVQVPAAMLVAIGMNAAGAARWKAANAPAGPPPRLQVAQVQDRSREPAPHRAGKGMDACKADIQRFCDDANLTQECLVAHWNKISSECQEVLAIQPNPDDSPP